MSVKNQQIVKCPNCGTEKELTLYSSINSSIEPNLRRILFSGEINFFVCSGCSHKSYLPIPLLYNDINRAFAVQFYPVSFIKKPEFTEQFNLDGSLKIQDDDLDFDVPEYMYDVHIVFDMNELISYIIFRETLYQKFNKQ